MKAILSWVLAVATADTTGRLLHAGRVDGCTKWSEWHNRDDPSGQADSELLGSFNLFPDSYGYMQDGLPGDMCANPIAAQARVVGTHQNTTSQNVRFGLDGLWCINMEQPGSEQCNDYEIRFCCPGKFTLIKNLW